MTYLTHIFAIPLPLLLEVDPPQYQLHFLLHFCAITSLSIIHCRCTLLCITYNYTPSFISVPCNTESLDLFNIPRIPIFQITCTLYPLYTHLFLLPLGALLTSFCLTLYVCTGTCIYVHVYMQICILNYCITIHVYTYTYIHTYIHT